VDFSRRLVLVQTLIDDLAQQFVLGPGEELDLCDELRADPMHAAQHCIDQLGELRPDMARAIGSIAGLPPTELLLGRKTLGGKRIGRRHGSFFDLGQQPGLNGGGCQLSLRIVMGETADLENYGAQLGNAAATSVVEMHKRKAEPGHRVLPECDRRCRRQAMLAAQVQKSADKAMAAIPVIITAARPVAIVGKKLEHQI